MASLADALKLQGKFILHLMSLRCMMLLAWTNYFVNNQLNIRTMKKTFVIGNVHCLLQQG